jgi:meso-butanediol dehydrogenase / (S,S)-butanediol dehydrogenase / diacetyl reductase
MRLADKVAIITGGGSGIGRGIAVAYAHEGARIAICGRDRKKLDAVAGEIGPACMAVAVDVSAAKQVELLVRMAVEHFGRVTTLVNNAGLLLAGTAESLRDDEWEQTFNVNVRGPWLLARAALPHLRAAGGGSIINLGSVLSTLGARNRVAYAASKGAVLAMTRAMALDHAADKIRVNCICPGIVETEMVAAFNMDEAARKQRLAMHPLGRFGQPEDVAGLAVFLASDDSSWITGSAYNVDGGYAAL